MADLTFKDFQATTVTDNAGQEVEVSIECVDVVQPEAPEEVCPSCIPNPKTTKNSCLKFRLFWHSHQYSRTNKCW